MATNDSGTRLSSSLERLAERLKSAARTRPGGIVFVVTGKHGGHYQLECAPGVVNLTSAPTRSDRAPLIEVIADAEVLDAILNGKRDARKQFLEGGLRVRGDLRYLSDIALELGILKTPL